MKKSQPIKAEEVKETPVEAPVEKSVERVLNCKPCKGEGLVGENRCPECGGTGKVE